MFLEEINEKDMQFSACHNIQRTVCFRRNDGSHTCIHQGIAKHDGPGMGTDV